MKFFDRLAIAPLRKAVNLNPKNIKANKLLADLLLEQGEFEQAREVLVGLYELEPVAARSRLIQALFGLADSTDNDDNRFKFYERILELDSKQTKARLGCEKIWQRRAELAYNAGDLESALDAYKAAHIEHKVAELEIKLRYRGIDAELKRLNELIQANRYQDALIQVAELANKYHDERDWMQFKQEIWDRDIDARLKIIAEFKEATRYDEALKALRGLAADYPKQRDWAKFEAEIPQHEFQTRFKLITESEKAGNYEQALDEARLMLDDYIDKGDWAEDKIRQKIQFLEQELRHTELDDRLTTLEYNKNQPETKTILAGLFQRAFNALRENDRNTAESLLSEVVILEKNYQDETRTLHFSVTGNDVIDVVKTMYQSVENITEYRQQEENLKQLVAQEKNRWNQTEEKLIESSQQEDNLKQLLLEEKKALVKTEQELLEYRQKEQELAKRLKAEQQALIEFSQRENDLKQTVEQEKQIQSELTQQKNELEQHLEQEKNALVKTEQELVEYRQKEQELAERLKAEQQALIESQKGEKKLKQALEDEKDARVQAEELAKLQALSEFSQRKNELTQQKTELEQRLEQEKKVVSEHIQRENELKQALEEEKYALLQAEELAKQQALLEFTQRENELKQTLDEEKSARLQAEELATELAQQKEQSDDKYQQELVQIQNELITKETEIDNAKPKNKDKPKSRPYLGFIVGSLFLGIILIVSVSVWKIINYKPPMSVKATINEPEQPATIIVKKPTPPTPTIPAVNPYKKICVHFKKRSWISISDKNGNNLYEGIYKLGDILVPKGEPPFYMKVGEMSGVYVGYDCSEINPIIHYPKQIGSKNIFIIGREK